MAVKLNEAVARNAAPPAKGQRFLFDTEVRGLALRIGASGAKSWMLAARIKGRPRRWALGPYPALPVAAARIRARQAQAAIAAGADPIAARRADRAEKTFAEFFAVYLDRHARPRKRTAASDEKVVGRYVPTAWNARRLSDISPAEVAKLHQTIGAEHGPYAANGLIRLLRSMFNRAVDWGYLPETHRNPARRIEFFPETKRDRFLNDDELARVLGALDDEPDVRWRVYFRLLLILGSRRTELLSARWEHVDMEKSVWFLPDTKAKRSHVLPLPPEATALLRTLPSAGKSEYLFPGVGKKGHMTEPKKAWSRIRTAAKVPDVRVHDLRRTLGSRLAMSGESLPLIAKVLNHSQLATTQIYARLGLAPMRAALEKNAAAMMELTGK